MRGVASARIRWRYQGSLGLIKSNLWRLGVALGRDLTILTHSRLRPSSSLVIGQSFEFLVYNRDLCVAVFFSWPPGYSPRRNSWRLSAFLFLQGEDHAGEQLNILPV